MGLFEIFLLMLAFGGGSGGSGSTTRHGWSIGPGCQTVNLVDPQAWMVASAGATTRLVLQEGVTDPLVLLQRLLREFLPQCEHKAAELLTPAVRAYASALIGYINGTPQDVRGRVATLTDGSGLVWTGPYEMLRATLMHSGHQALVDKADALGIGGAAIEGTREVRRVS